MEDSTYHGEITKITPDHRQTLSIDIMHRRFGDVSIPFVCLSVWNDNEYDPASEFDLTPPGARLLAAHLRAAADRMEWSELPAEDSDDDFCKGKLSVDELRMLPLLKGLSNGIVEHCLKVRDRNAE